MNRIIKSIKIQLAQADQIFKPASPDEVVERKDQYKGKRIEELKKEGTLRSDGYYNFTGDVDLSDEDLTELPQHFFGLILGSMLLDGNNLRSLVGCPDYVGGDFICYGNSLTNLKGCPKTVGGDFFSEFYANQIRRVCKVGGAINTIDAAKTMSFTTQDH